MWYRERPTVWLWEFSWLLEGWVCNRSGARCASICLAYDAFDEVRTHRAVIREYVSGRCDQLRVSPHLHLASLSSITARLEVVFIVPVLLRS